MIKEYTIANFKAFSDPVTIPIKPITLIFGPNSSGKSSIFQSLLMLKQTVEDESRTESILLTKGDLVDLGSYLEFVHNHDVSRSLSIKFSTTAPKTIYDMFELDYFPPSKSNPYFERLAKTVDFDTMGLKISFVPRQKAGITVGQINLFLGEELKPIASYVNKGRDCTFVERLNFAKKHADEANLGGALTSFREAFNESVILHQVNTDHNYWKSYYSEFCSEDCTYTLYLWNVLNDDSEDYFPDILLDFKNKPEADTCALWQRLHQKGYDSLAKVHSDSPSEILNGLLEVPILYDFLVHKGEKIYSYPVIDHLLELTAPYRQIPFSNLTCEQQETIRKLNLLVIHKLSFLCSSTDLSVEPFGTPQLLSDFEEEFIGLRHFLPERGKMGKYENVFRDSYGADSISLFAMSAGETFRKFLKNIQFVGPLRPAPERFYVFSGNRTGFVGSTGKFVLDILVPDNDLLAAANRHFLHLGMDYELIVSELSSGDTGINSLLTLRLRKKSTGVITGLADVGFGISQVLPIVVQSALSKEKVILIEQPELHLHPAQQAELGDVFIESALGENKNTFLIETHSEHLILRLLRRIRETAEGTLENGAYPLKPKDIAVIYAKPTPQGTKLIELRVSDDGDFVDKWPDGFFAERAKELF